MINFKLEKFEGPLDLLLQLIESQELDITQVSLAKVADQYLAYIQEAETLIPEEMADFLVVAAKLLVIKSRALLPGISLAPEEESEGLERQLKIYKEFLAASKIINKLWAANRQEFSREKILQMQQAAFCPPPKISIELLRQIFSKILGKIQPIITLPKRLIAKTVSIQEKILNIKAKIFKELSIKFDNLLEDQGSKIEKIVSFLALLELVKQKEVYTEQSGNFSDIFIHRTKNDNNQ